MDVEVEVVATATEEYEAEVEATTAIIIIITHATALDTGHCSLAAYLSHQSYVAV